MGTKMVADAQTAHGAFTSQNPGGPLKVAKTLAASISGIRDVREEVNSVVPICSEEKIPVQIHSTPTIEALNDEAMQRDVAIAVKIRRAGAPLTSMNPRSEQIGKQATKFGAHLELQLP